jgi:hypothetical protein
MCKIIYEAVERELNGIGVGLQLRTPDNIKGSPFSIQAVHHPSITITLKSGNLLPIQYDAFFAAMLYLVRNGHSIQSPLPIESNNDPALAGPLCLISRQQNDNVRCINYIIPILANFGYVGFAGQRPNMCWYA